MDSVTQIILGAGVGEIVLGKKLGNRAMVWGAIAGTIPDLDIIGNAFMGELEALAFHRGISHSIFFAITFSFLMAVYTRWFYQNQYHQQRFVRSVVSILIMAFLGLVGVFATNLFSKVYGTSGLLVAGAVSTLFVLFSATKLWKKYVSKSPDSLDISYREWYWFFFWCVFTHPILDCFTTYGTQLFAPFSNYRVAFNTISVADPAYTIPFFLCVFIASRFLRNNESRRKWTWAGIGISSLYLLFTVYNKGRVNQVLENTLAAQNIDYDCYMTSPTILNNFLWSASVKTSDGYYLGTYAFNDQEDIFKLRFIPKNEHLVDGNIDDHTIKTLRWFSKDYYGFIRRKDGRIQMNDLRFGKFDISGSGENDYIFRFILEEIKPDQYILAEAMGGPSDEDRKNMMGNLWNRLKGI